MRRAVAIGILTTILCGLMGWVAAEVSKIGVHEERLSQLEKQRTVDRQEWREDFRDLKRELKEEIRNVVEDVIDRRPARRR